MRDEVRQSVEKQLVAILERWQEDLQTPQLLYVSVDCVRNDILAIPEIAQGLDLLEKGDGILESLKEKGYSLAIVDREAKLPENPYTKKVTQLGSYDTKRKALDDQGVYYCSQDDMLKAGWVKEAT